MAVRFDNIHPTARGKDDAFKELTCQLARRHRPGKAGEFRRIHGAGGDGGIECYWTLEDGSEVGYQAKYYLRSGEAGYVGVGRVTGPPKLRLILWSQPILATSFSWGLQKRTIIASMNGTSIAANTSFPCNGCRQSKSSRQSRRPGCSTILTPSADRPRRNGVLQSRD